jgi:hypothetical protein
LIVLEVRKKLLYADKSTISLRYPDTATHLRFFEVDFVRKTLPHVLFCTCCRELSMQGIGINPGGDLVPTYRAITLLHVGEGFIPQTTIEKVTFETSARVAQGDFANDR